jgi:uncharacterized protein
MMKNYCMITGASQGLGKAFAEEYAKRGSNLLLVALPDSGLDKVAFAIAERWEVDIKFVETDLTEEGNVQSLFNFIKMEKIAVDTLINNAGIGSSGAFHHIDIERSGKILDLNIKALIQLTYMMLPELHSHPRAYILNVASLAAFYPMPYMAVYAATKVFVLNFSRALGEELGNSGISVTALCPGGIATNSACGKRIDALGFFGKITCFSASHIARQAICSLHKGKAVVIPGAANRLLRFFGTYFPKHLVIKVIGSRFGQEDMLEFSGTPVAMAAGGCE